MGPKLKDKITCLTSYLQYLFFIRENSEKWRVDISFPWILYLLLHKWLGTIFCIYRVSPWPCAFLFMISHMQNAIRAVLDCRRNFREGTFPSQIHLTFSNPSQLLCNSSMLLKSFSKRKPSQCLLKSKCWKIFNLLKWKYLLSSFSNGVYVLHQKKPSQILLNGNTFSAPSQMKYMFYISSYDLLWN